MSCVRSVIGPMSCCSTGRSRGLRQRHHRFARRQQADRRASGGTGPPFDRVSVWAARAVDRRRTLAHAVRKRRAIGCRHRPPRPVHADARPRLRGRRCRTRQRCNRSGGVQRPACNWNSAAVAAEKRGCAWRDQRRRPRRHLRCRLLPAVVDHRPQRRRARRPNAGRLGAGSDREPTGHPDRDPHPTRGSGIDGTIRCVTVVFSEQQASLTQASSFQLSCSSARTNTRTLSNRPGLPSFDVATVQRTTAKVSAASTMSRSSLTRAGLFATPAMNVSRSTKVVDRTCSVRRSAPAGSRRRRGSPHR